MRKKGFTLVELLVVIAIIALLMGILMPALSRVRQMANRIVCGSNLSGLGKACLVYSNDNDASYPVGGYPVPDPRGRAPSMPQLAQDGQIDDYDADTRRDAFGTQREATIGSCWYLLCKYASCSPENFICKGDTAEKLQVEDIQDDTISNLDRLWDFTNNPGKHYSYSYQNPFAARSPNFTVGSQDAIVPFPVTADDDPGTPVAADRNPWFDINANYRNNGLENDPDYDEVLTPEEYWDQQGGEYVDQEGVWNAAAHNRNGQNVLFADGHVEFAKSANVGIDNDNIWFTWGGLNSQEASQRDKQVGNCPGDELQDISNAEYPNDKKDACLINEPQIQG